MSELGFRNSIKRRLDEIDYTLDELSESVRNRSDCEFKTELQYKIMSARLKRERIQALETVARSQTILSDMNLLIAENDLIIELETLKSCKKIKLDSDVPIEESSRKAEAHPTPTKSSKRNKSSQVPMQCSTPKPKSHKSTKKINKRTTEQKCDKKSKDSEKQARRTFESQLLLADTQIIKAHKIGTSCNSNRENISKSNSLFENRNKQPSVDQILNTGCKSNLNMEGKNIFNPPLNIPLKPAKHKLPQIITRPSKYKNALQPKVLDNNLHTSEINNNELNKQRQSEMRHHPTPEVDPSNDADHHQTEFMDKFFREMMLSKDIQPPKSIMKRKNKNILESSMNSATTLHLEEILSR